MLATDSPMGQLRPDATEKTTPLLHTSRMVKKDN